MRRILTAPPVLAAVLAIIALYAVSAGSVAVPTSDTLAVVTAKLMGHEPFIDPAVTDIIWELRVPRVLLA
ncbi:MAG: iron ABC transporter permease, partial [Selenomonas artemidis]|nr:iron ABC transporter permease [Selenomonas artemidis]